MKLVLIMYFYGSTQVTTTTLLKVQMHFPLTCSKLRKDRKTKLKIFQQVKLGREAKMQQQVVDGRGIASSSQGERLAVLTDQEEVCPEYAINDPQD